MQHTAEIIAGVEADVLAAEGAFHVDGTYYAIFGDADRARRRLGTRIADSVVRIHAWAFRGATVDGAPVRPTFVAVPQLLERCAWCGQRFEPDAPAVHVASRLLHDRACRDEFDRLIAEAEVDRAHATLRLVEVRHGRDA